LLLNGRLLVIGIKPVHRQDSGKGLRSQVSKRTSKLLPCSQLQAGRGRTRISGTRDAAAAVGRNWDMDRPMGRL